LPKFCKQVDQHSLQILAYLVVPEAHHSKPSAEKRLSPSCVAPFIMLSPIDFDYQSLLDATEVNDVTANRPLPLELESAEPSIAELKPHRSFSLSHTSSQWSGMGAYRTHGAA
jgi:hypothetical protein